MITPPPVTLEKTSCRTCRGIEIACHICRGVATFTHIRPGITINGVPRRDQVRVYMCEREHTTTISTATDRRPPAIWGPDVRFADIGVIPSPAPKIDRKGWTVTLSGIRFEHQHHCGRCRKVIHTSTEGGTYSLGFDSKGRSFESWAAGARPVFAGNCPSCDQPVIVCGPPLHGGFPVADAYDATRGEWEHLRRTVAVSTVDMTRADLARLSKEGRK